MRPLLLTASRVLLLLGVVSTGTLAAWALARAPLSAAAAGAVPPDTAVLAACGCLLLAATAWLDLLTLALAVEALTGLRAPGWLRDRTPAVLRGLVLAGCGAALTSVTVGAPVSAEPAGPLDGLTLPDRTVGQAIGRSMGGEAGSPVLTVRAGDSLWSITEHLIGEAAPDDAVDAGWRRLYRANRPRVGSDPDLVLPGTVLRIPTTTAFPTSPALPPTPAFPTTEGTTR